MRIFQILLLSFLCISTAQAGEPATESKWVSAQQVQGKLIGAGDEVAVQLRLAKGWHTYWRVPGDAGLPPRFDWSGSTNLATIDMGWPAPQRFEELDLQTFGYEDEIVFPARIKRKDEGVQTVLALKADVMVCKDICVPETLTLNLPLVDESSQSVSKIIEFAQRKVPVKGDVPGLKIDTVVAGPDGLVLNVFSQNGFKSFDVFAFAETLAFTAVPEVTVDEKEPRKALVKIPTPPDIENLSAFLGGKKLSMTIANGKEAVEKVIEF